MPKNNDQEEQDQCSLGPDRHPAKHYFASDVDTQKIGTVQSTSSTSKDKENFQSKSNIELFKNNPDLQSYWDAFFKDDFILASAFAEKLRIKANTQKELDLAINLATKPLLRQGKINQAKETIQASEGNQGLKLFIQFITDANPKGLIEFETDDIDSLIYKAQSILISKIYWGENYLARFTNLADPEELLEQVFTRLLANKQYDKAILAAIQGIELGLEDQILSHDIHLPIIHEQLNNLIVLSTKAKYQSTKAKLYLLKSRIFKDKEAAKDAEILFGQDQNKNGLGETYMYYAKELNELEYYKKALINFDQTDNLIAQGFIYESMASMALVNGEVKHASQFFDKAEAKLNNGGIFEHYGLAVQRISLFAIKGKYQTVKEHVHALIKPTVPSFFVAQAYQILANTLIQLGEDTDTAKAYIETACEIFKQLNRYSQLMYTQNVYFQIMLLENDLEKIEKLGNEIIQLATRLGNEEIKATKYLDLAFITIRLSLEDSNLDNEKIANATDYFNKAIRLYQDLENVTGEADTYQAMGNMFTGIGKLEEALNAFLKAKQLYQQEKALLQSAVTDTLVGILMLNYVVLNEQTYPIAMRHLEQALLYFSSENLLDLLWKALFYLADLNHRYYIERQGQENEDVLRNKAKTYYLEMLVAVQDYQEDAPNLPGSSQEGLVGITIKDAFNKAYQFFLTIGEQDTANKFKNRNQL
ncbi:MAG: hypothetical protein O3C63_08635 [Cyanobacteria bacterium]|nr:hypothetical protein [Cyanobacteriota bacterium]MDA1021314.1 hypothetical protein [Cyanobacteriota bacterium]